MNSEELDALEARLRSRTSNSHMLLCDPPRPAPDTDCVLAAAVIADLRRQLAEAQCDKLLLQVAEMTIEAQAQQLAERDADIARYREALERLARLGNGERPGNSDGNMIARRALENGHG